MKILIKISLLLSGLLFLSFSYQDGNGPCHPDKIYATKDYMYADTYFKDYEKVKKFPSYLGGKDSIQTYFDRLVKFEGTETQLVAKYHVTFIVNCKGELSQFELRSKQFPGFEKIMEACKNMPGWVPAKKGKEPVDCYLRLGFTNQAGKLVVDYRED